MDLPGRDAEQQASDVCEPHLEDACNPSDVTITLMTLRLVTHYCDDSHAHTTILLRVILFHMVNKRKANMTRGIQ